MFPGTDERGQHGHGAGGGATILGALDAVVHANDGGSDGGVFAGQPLDVLRRYACVARDTLGGVFGGAAFELVETVRVSGDIVAVVKRVADDDVHEPKGEGGIGSGSDGDVPVSQARGSCRVGIDDYEPGALATGLFDHRPEMDVVAMNVGSPGDDEAGIAKGLGVGAELAAVYGQERVTSGSGADGAVELRGSEAMEEAAIHRAVSQDADGAGVGIGQDRFGSVLAR